MISFGETIPTQNLGSDLNFVPAESSNPVWLVDWLFGWLAGWLVGWLAGWLVGWLVGWFDD